MPGRAPEPEVRIADFLRGPQVLPSAENQAKDWCDFPTGLWRVSAPESISRPSGVAVSFASRRSEVGEVISAADCQFRPSADVITLSAPSGETWLFPSRKTQNHCP